MKKIILGLLTTLIVSQTFAEKKGGDVGSAGLLGEATKSCQKNINWFYKHTASDSDLNSASMICESLNSKQCDMVSDYIEKFKEIEDGISQGLKPHWFSIDEKLKLNLIFRAVTSLKKPVNFDQIFEFALESQYPQQVEMLIEKREGLGLDYIEKLNALGRSAISLATNFPKLSYTEISSIIKTYPEDVITSAMIRLQVDTDVSLEEALLERKEGPSKLHLCNLAGDNSMTFSVLRTFEIPYTKDYGFAESRFSSDVERVANDLPRSQPEETELAVNIASAQDERLNKKYEKMVVEKFQASITPAVRSELEKECAKVFNSTTCKQGTLKAEILDSSFEANVVIGDDPVRQANGQYKCAGKARMVKVSDLPKNSVHLKYCSLPVRVGKSAQFKFNFIVEDLTNKTTVEVQQEKCAKALTCQTKAVEEGFPQRDIMKTNELVQSACKVERH
ncbi:MAG: hypothetical protein V4654_13305 [Bdellovibrionota bacterium]